MTKRKSEKRKQPVYSKVGNAKRALWKKIIWWTTMICSWDGYEILQISKKTVKF
jgi:hypothetical protein